MHVLNIMAYCSQGASQAHIVLFEIFLYWNLYMYVAVWKFVFVDLDNLTQMVFDNGIGIVYA